MNIFLILVVLVSVSNFSAAGGLSDSIAEIYLLDTSYGNTNQISLLKNGKYLNTNTDVVRSYKLSFSKKEYYLSLNEMEFFNFQLKYSKVGDSWKSESKSYRIASVDNANEIYTIFAESVVQSPCIDNVREKSFHFSFRTDLGLVSATSMLERCDSLNIVGAVSYSFDWKSDI